MARGKRGEGLGAAEAEGDTLRVVVDEDAGLEPGLEPGVSEPQKAAKEPMPLEAQPANVRADGSPASPVVTWRSNKANLHVPMRVSYDGAKFDEGANYESVVVTFNLHRFEVDTSTPKGAAIDEALKGSGLCRDGKIERLDGTRQAVAITERVRASKFLRGLDVAALRMRLDRAEGGRAAALARHGLDPTCEDKDTLIEVFLAENLSL